LSYTAIVRRFVYLGRGFVLPLSRFSSPKGDTYPG